ncbi:hypothetical protein KCV01_g17413, partial [Aureobasidium melanogenum]
RRPQQNRRDVVPRTPTERLQQQLIHALLRRDVATRHDLAKPLIGDLVGQAIGAQQQPRTRPQLAPGKSDMQLVGQGDPERLGQHAALRMHPRLRLGQFAGLDQRLDDGMVVRQTLEPGVPAIDPAVAHPGGFIAPADDPHGGDGRAHGPRLRQSAGPGDQGFVDPLDRVHQRLPGTDLGHHAIARRGRGHFAVPVPAHAVHHQEEPQGGVGV